MSTNQQSCDQSVSNFLRTVRARFFASSSGSTTTSNKESAKPEVQKNEHWINQWDKAPTKWKYFVSTLEKVYGLSHMEESKIKSNNKTYIETPELTRRAHLGTSAIILTVGGISKIMLKSMNSLKAYNLDILHNYIENRSPKRGLITVSNHQSVFDDPFLLASVLPPHILLNARSMRWGLCSMDICFQDHFASRLLRLGKALPIKRFGGLNQKFLMDVSDKLSQAGWVHIFPEGRVRQLGMGYFKRGIGKILTTVHERNNYDLDLLPVILPIYHEGIEKVMPQKLNSNGLESLFPKKGQQLFLYVGQPVDVSHIFERLMPECERSGGTSSDAPPCLKLYEELADFLAIVMRLIRADARIKIKEEENVDLGEPFEYS